MIPFDRLLDQPLVLLIPAISGAVGWITNVLAIRMMFYPVRFVGLAPGLGWQGIVPANATRLARTGLKLVTTRLLDVRELFRDMEPDGLVEEHRDELGELARSFVEREASKNFPAMWEALGDDTREQIVDMARSELVRLTSGVLDDAREHIDQLLDIEELVMDAVVHDPELLNRIFLRVGAREFRFIEQSGLWFGTLFGLVQLVVWITYPAWWILPVFGFAVGYLTNWVALRLVFEPKHPRWLGPLVIQGLFHRRQREIAHEFAEIMTERVLNGDRLFDAIADGPSRDRLLEFVRRHGRELIERYRDHPMASGMLRDDLVARFEEQLLDEAERTMFQPGGLVHRFADRSARIRDELVERMKRMEAQAFENVLRPAFQQDEWKLIVAGAALGGLAGVLQVAFLFRDMVL